MNTRELKAFMQVYECKSISLAANYLYISPQGLSRIIMRLENDLNTILFLRRPNGVEATEAGNRLYLRSKNIIEQLDLIYQEVHEPSNVILTVPCTKGFMRLASIKLITDFKDTHPDINLRLYEKNDVAIDEQITEGDAEIGILTAPVDSIKYEATPLTRSAICVVANKSNPIAEHETVVPSDLAGIPILTSTSSEFHAYQRQGYASIKRESNLNIVFEATDIELLLSMVNSNMGTALVAPLHEIADEYPNTKIIPFLNNTYYWETYLVHRKSYPISSAAQKFKTFMIQWLQNNVPDAV